MWWQHLPGDQDRSPGASAGMLFARLHYNMRRFRRRQFLQILIRVAPGAVHRLPLKRGSKGWDAAGLLSPSPVPSRPRWPGECALCSFMQKYLWADSSLLTAWVWLDIEQYLLCPQEKFPSGGGSEMVVLPSGSWLALRYRHWPLYFPPLMRRISIGLQSPL